jgi:hypothetical protein
VKAAPKCPDCKKRATKKTSKGWRCLWCHAAGVFLAEKLVVVSRHVTYSGPLERRTKPKGNVSTTYFGGGFGLNEHHPGSSLLTKLRARLAS